MNEAAWAQLKTLNPQTEDLSPWLTEEVRAEHLQVSDHGGPSASSPKSALTQMWTSIERRHWKVLAVIVAICRFDAISTMVARISAV